MQSTHRSRFFFSIFENFAQGAQQQRHILAPGRVAHEAHAPDLALERAKAGADLDAVVGAEAGADARLRRRRAGTRTVMRLGSRWAGGTNGTRSSSARPAQK